MDRNRRSRERHQEPTGILRGRRVSAEANIDPSPISASENEKLGNAVPSLQSKLEKLGRDAVDVSEQYKIIEDHNTKVEQENIRLKRENDLLKQRNASTSTTLSYENTPENDEDTPENDEDNGRNQTFTDEETPSQNERQQSYYEKIWAFLQWLYALGVSVLKWSEGGTAKAMGRNKRMIAATQMP